MDDDILELKQDVKEILQRTAVHNELLRTHESRSLALQASQDKLDARIVPIEKHVNLISAVLKVLGAILVGVAVQYVIRRVLSL